MSGQRVKFSVFTKPWKTLPLGELGSLVRGMGFDGVELPVRPGFQVTPERAKQGLCEAVRALSSEGIEITSVAAPTGSDGPDHTRSMIEACGESRVPVLRIFPFIREGERYLEGEARLQRELETLIPALEDASVTIGIQNHCGPCYTSAMHLLHLIEEFEPRHVGAILDAGHTGLAGEEPELALDVVWSHLCMVNFKNAFRKLLRGPEAEHAEWQVYWTNGRNGLANWGRFSEYLKRRCWNGVLCLTAEYSDHDAVDRLIAADLQYAKSLFSS